MNHKLMFEPSWEKAISAVDRKSITTLYEKSSPIPGKIVFTQIRAALNHRGALLAMALIQNGTDQAFPIQDITLLYEEVERGTIAEESFNIPGIVVEANTSMPWTFVFPKSTIKQRPALHHWKLVFGGR